MSSHRYQSWEEYRRQIIAETERFIEFGLKHPDLVIEIPAKPVDEGGFPRQVAEWFWGTVLCANPTGRVRRWRDMLLRRPRGLLRRPRQRVPFTRQPTPPRQQAPAAIDG